MWVYVGLYACKVPWACMGHSVRNGKENAYIYIYIYICSGGWDAAGPPCLQCFWAFSNVLYEYLGVVIWGHPTHE